MDLAKTRIAILGAGNIGGAIGKGLVDSHLIAADRVTLTRRKADALEDFNRLGFVTTSDNGKAIKNSDVVFVAVTPQQLNPLLSEVKGFVDERRHIIVSLVSGVTIAELRKHLNKRVPIIRAMPNTAIAIRQSMTCLSAESGTDGALTLVKQIFDSLGRTLVINEELMVPATALCACGIAFFLRAIRAASQGGIEIGFHAEEALLMAAQTALGASALLVQPGSHPEREVDKVTTPQGCTISGLNQMEHNGFSSALIKGIVTSAEKAAVLYRPNPGKSIQ
jgi:pyrroline-5-carboxylate reductase